MPYKKIFSPLTFRNLTIKNRVLRSNVAGRFDNYDGTGAQPRINWEVKFARGGVGAIISSFVPVHPRGRILPNYATIVSDDRIPFWRALGKAVHEHDCKYILQLSHGGRQRDIPTIDYPARSELDVEERSAARVRMRGDDARADQGNGAGVCRGRTARARSGARRRRAARRERLPDHPVPELGDQRSNGRVRRRPRQSGASSFARSCRRSGRASDAISTCR